MRKSGTGRDAVQVGSNRPHVFCDRPFVVIEHDDESLRLRPRVVERFVTDAAGESGVTGYGDNMLIATAEVASHGHPESGGERRSSVPCAVAVMFALGAQEEAVQSLVLPHGGNAIEAAGKHLVDVTLMTDIEDETILWRLEDAMECNR